MSTRIRLVVFLTFAAGFAALLGWGLSGLPAFGDYRGPYGDLVNASGVPERHVTNMPTAVNFDYRGFDTLGEEYILFAAVTGLALLLRAGRGEIEDEPREYASDRRVPSTGDAVRWLGLLLAGATVVFGIDVVIHAQLTPGGGFQGGTLLGTACLLVYLTGTYPEFRAVSPKLLMDVAEAAGAGAYALIGLATLAATGAFLANALPLGQTGNLLSGGTIFLVNLAVGLEVSGGFILMFSEFLKETRKPSQEKGP